jgi:hypothetical protein
MQGISTVASDYGGIFSITKTTYVDISAYRGFNKKLTDYCRDYSETEYY